MKFKDAESRGFRALTTLVLIYIYISNFGYATSSTVRYDLGIKTFNLGNYEIVVESHEIPSYEYLPIFDDHREKYFTHSNSTLSTEVDNEPPSAIYHSKTVAKVDVVFALGDTAQSEAFQAYIPYFKSQLESASNFIDAHVEQVKTSTIDMAAFGAREIFNTWTKMPEADGFGAKVWKLNEEQDRFIVRAIRSCLAEHIGHL